MIHVNDDRLGRASQWRHVGASSRELQAQFRPTHRLGVVQSRFSGVIFELSSAEVWLFSLAKDFKTDERQCPCFMSGNLIYAAASLGKAAATHFKSFNGPPISRRSATSRNKY
ncbi:hypothetical protein AcW1_000734 [Taiwanofungus camphoratus]|nr:hypothetical protein AcW2_000764 [Antrodia cinnamomea]KAI0936517.1 hypothetical protein AcV5_004634 [Antrodia cinnamomea]KAI0961732.1 hypothetical protein AcV7_000754 [Antrodia cinnamomea]KAI0963743.1 hypothetical protein AcW1_000734 [Antrodia cinnamomea]